MRSIPKLPALFCIFMPRLKEQIRRSPSWAGPLGAVLTHGGGDVFLRKTIIPFIIKGYGVISTVDVFRGLYRSRSGKSNGHTLEIKGWREISKGGT